MVDRKKFNYAFYLRVSSFTVKVSISDEFL